MYRERPKFHRNAEGTAAIEFAIIAPVFILMLFGMIAFGIWLGAANTIQQVTAGAARASVAGLTSKEREALARDYVTNSLLANGLIDVDRVDVSVAEDPDVDDRFRVTVTFDATHLPIWDLIGSDLLPGQQIQREAVIVVGGR